MNIIGQIKAILGIDKTKFDQGLKGAEKSSNKFVSAIKKMAGALAAAFSIGVIINFGKEIIKLASKVEGVKTAFNSLNKPTLLDDLRTATRGTVTDLELMQKAVQARNFKIPLDQLATYFEFATKRAIQTGESVDYLVNSIITGLGRKSILVMDNLGISAVELQEETKKTGDFATAAGIIIRRELTSMGDVSDTAATKMASFGTTIINLKTNLGKVITESKLFTDAITGMNKAVDNIVDQQDDMNTINESSLSKWDKLIFKLAKYTKVGREAINTMADGIRKQNELTDATAGTSDETEEQIKTIADYKGEIQTLTDELETLTAGEGKRAEAINKQINELKKLINTTLLYKTIVAAIPTAKIPSIGGIPTGYTPPSKTGLAGPPDVEIKIPDYAQDIIDINDEIAQDFNDTFSQMGETALLFSNNMLINKKPLQYRKQ